MAKTKCCFCHKEIDIDSAYKNSRWYYCDETCFKNKRDKLKYKPPKELPDKTINPRRQLTDYIMLLYIKRGFSKYEIPWQMLMAQIKNLLTENRNFKYSSIKYTLWYMNEIENVNLFDTQSNGSVLSLVPFYHEKAKLYYETTIMLKNDIQAFNIKDDKEIKVKIAKKDKKYKEIDFE